MLILIILVAGPLQELDYSLAHLWFRRFEPDLEWFAQNILNRVSSQAVCLPVLIVVALVLARRRGSWRPIVFALASELAFLVGIGGLKVLLARGVTYERNPALLEGGLWEMGTKGISFPSGHAAESVLIYGAAVYLISQYSGASRRLVRLLCWGVALISVNSVVISFVLGWHWASDLVGGLLAGGLFLRILMRWDEYDLLTRRSDL